jgi:hypothetical protein
MSIKNITGLEKPLEKLVETVSEGVGVLSNHWFEFDAKKIKRIGKVEAESEKEKIIANAEAQGQAIAILGRAEKRFALEQYYKQVNLENILARSKEYLKGKEVSPDPVEKDWTMKFFNIAQNVSREELQDILAKILSGEIQEPGKFSYQTLETIKFLSKKDLNKFLPFLASSTALGVIRVRDEVGDSMYKYNLDFNDYLNLSSLGLFNQSSSLSYDVNINKNEKFLVEIGNYKFIIRNKDPQISGKFDFSLYVFSNVGRELRSILLDQATNPKLEEYKEALKKNMETKGFIVFSEEEGSKNQEVQVVNKDNLDEKKAKYG